jgi:hypothetical protein
MIPTKSPGSLFSSLTGGDDTLNVRWLVATDPAMFEVLNRPTADVVVRQLVIAKAVDQLQLRLGHQALFPFVVQPIVSSSSAQADVPIGWIWDMHASLPKKWEKVRLAKIKRISGENSTTNGYTGVLRCIFTANVLGSETEVSVLYADYKIDSLLTYQTVRLLAVPSTEESVIIPTGEDETVGGFLMFRTLDADLLTVQDFYNVVAPPTNTTDGDNDGIYDYPAIYEISDMAAGGANVTDDVVTSTLAHGSGLLTDSAWNAIPELNSDIQSWINAFNYPFDSNVNLRSGDNITIPKGLFREFDITVPAGDQPTGDATGTYYPVWLNRIERVDNLSNHLRFYYSTYNVTDTASGGNPSTTAVEFASLDLLRSYASNEIIEIVPINNLILKSSSITNYQQHFGRGHVVLSTLWDKTATDIDDFFDAFLNLVASPTAETMFSLASARLSSFGLSRVPKYVPTIGQSRALLGSTSRRTTPIDPSYDNRYVTELDQGVGNQIDLEAQNGITPNSAIDRYGFSGALAHKICRLVIDATQLGTEPAFYDTHVAPRLKVLLGRDPAFGDFWYNGTRLMFYNGDSWQG